MTQKFNFRLQGVLDLFELKEELLQQDLAKLLSELLLEKNKLGILKDDYEYTREKLEEELAGQPDLKKISFINDYLRFLDLKIKDEKKIIKVMEEVNATKRKELEKAMKDKNVMDNLKERRYEEYKHDVSKQEQKVIDEIGTQRFLYKNGSFSNGN